MSAKLSLSMSSVAPSAVRSEISEAELRSTIAELQLESHFGLVPFQRKAASIYGGLDSLVHPSERPGAVRTRDCRRDGNWATLFTPVPFDSRKQESS
jgi:hypothetical protein